MLEPELLRVSFDKIHFCFKFPLKTWGSLYDFHILGREEKEKVFKVLCHVVKNNLEALERLYRSTGLIFLQWQKKFLTIIIQSLHFSSLKKKGMEKTCEKRRKKW